MTLTRTEAARWIIVAVAILVFFIAGFLIGFAPQHAEVERLRARNQKVEHANVILESSLRIAELRGAAGLIQRRLDQNSFSAATELAIGFFNGVRRAINEEAGDTALRQNLRAILQQRDEVMKGLTEGDSGVGDRMADIYAVFFQIHASSAPLGPVGNRPATKTPR